MFKKLLNYEQKFTITKAAFIVGFFALLSKFVALVRDPLFTANFGGEKIYILDIYNAAFRIPDFIFSIFILGTLSVALIPIFVDLKVKDENSAHKFANTIITLAMLFMGAVFALLFIFAAPVTKALVPGFSAEMLKETISLTRIICLSQIIFTLSNICTNILYAYKRFIMAGIAPILYNVGIILGILLFYPRFGIIGLGYGVLFGAVCHLLVQLPGLSKSCLKLWPVWEIKTDAFKKFFKLYLPRIFAIDLPVFSLLIATFIGSNLQAGSIGIFTLSVNLLSLPVSIIALSLATAIFPALSESYARGDEAAFLTMLKKTLIQILFFMVPITLLMLIFRAQGVRLYLGHGNFTWENTILTFSTFGILAFSLISQSLSPILARAFYSRQNTATPLAINIVALSLNIGLAFALSQSYGILGLAAAFSIASIFNAITLFIVLRASLYRQAVNKLMLKEFDDGLVSTTLKIVLASVFMAITSYVSLYLLEPMVNTHTVIGLLIQVGCSALLGVAVFFAVGSLLKLKESQIILDYFRKILASIQPNKSKTGFTLIELLVVIAVISLLASVILVALNNTRAKARDARRIADMQQIQKALELYYNINSSYPASGGWVGDCNGAGSLDSVLAPLVAQGILARVPHDPKNPANTDPFCYWYNSAYTPVVSNDCGIPDGKTPYAIIISAEVTNNFQIPTHYNKLSAAERYCVAGN